jgi:hypothetical protein
MAEWVPPAIHVPLPLSALFKSPHFCSQQKTPFSHNALFLSQLLQPTKNHILAQRSLPLPTLATNKKSHPRTALPSAPHKAIAAQATSSSSSDEREDLQWSDEEEVEQRPIQVVVDTSSDDSEFVE